MLELEEGLIRIEAALVSVHGFELIERLVLDTGSANSILSAELAEFLGFPESRKTGVATYDNPDGPVLGYTARLPAMEVIGRRIHNYLVGCKVFHSRLQIPGILGLDFFEGTDLLLSLRRKKRSIHLAW